MKPKNFPERKRQRRLAALKRLEAQKEPVRKRDESDEQFAARKPAWRARRDDEIHALLQLAAWRTSQRDVRTKKYRGSGREYERSAQ